jgi:hypothetical protein
MMLRPYIDTNLKYALLMWEPMEGSGEILNVAAFCKHKENISSRVLISKNVLDVMQKNSKSNIGISIKEILHITEVGAMACNYEEALGLTLLFSNFKYGTSKCIWADNENDMYRQIALMNCSFFDEMYIKEYE